MIALPRYPLGSLPAAPLSLQPWSLPALPAQWPTLLPLPSPHELCVPSRHRHHRWMLLFRPLSPVSPVSPGELQPVSLPLTPAGVWEGGSDWHPDWWSRSAGAFVSPSFCVPPGQLACLRCLCLVCLNICECVSMCAQQCNISECRFGPSLCECACVCTHVHEHLDGTHERLCLCEAPKSTQLSPHRRPAVALPALARSIWTEQPVQRSQWKAEAGLSSLKVNSRGKSTTEELSRR